ncbi:MAG: cyanophycin synthetase, partial [Actinomycetota bacterium]
AAACAHTLGIDTGVIAAGLGGLESVPGRFEPIATEAPFNVVVDYAHNVDGLQKVMKAAVGLTEGKLILVFGCPGDRDRDKRPQMGLVAGSKADISVLTTDDCYSEEPEQILDEVEPGLRESGGRYLRISDRRRAIEAALAEAGPGDLVLIAGKGHETTQLMPSGPVPFSDSETVRELLRDS